MIKTNTLSKSSLVCISFTLMLSGCVTPTAPIQIDESEIENVPSDRIEAFIEPREDDAILRVTEFGSTISTGCFSSFLIDGKRVAKFQNNERAEFHIPAGEHEISLTHDWDGKLACSISKEEALKIARTVKIKAEPNKIYRVYLEKAGQTTFGGGILDSMLLNSISKNGSLLIKVDRDGLLKGASNATNAFDHTSGEILEGAEPYIKKVQENLF